MKKKCLVYLLAGVMALGFTACGNKGQTEEQVPSTESVQESVQESESPAEESSQEEPVDEESVGESSAEDTSNENSGESGQVSAIVMEDFKNFVEANPEAGAEQIAAALCENPALIIGPVTMPVEEGYLNGFGNTEIQGFADGCMFAPMIGSIPFVGYVFVLDEGADVEAFMNTLKENGDLRWNICTTADEMVVTNIENKVMFLMCPVSFED